VITLFEFEPAAGTKVRQIQMLEDDLALALQALKVRIAPIPGKGVLGIEVANREREVVYLKEIIGSEKFRRMTSKLPLALGKDISGEPVVADLAKMPHLLVAGTTGSGKSVGLNSMLVSILYQASPEEVRIILVDQKTTEFGPYDGVPHLLLPVVVDPKRAAVALRWAVEEMERRYALMSDLGVRHIGSYNKKVEQIKARGEEVLAPREGEGDLPPSFQKLPYVLIMIDELADLMMVAPREVEASLQRLAQMARAAGLHIVVATQRPSVDVISGVIRANFPARIAYQTRTRTDSRTILDDGGAEQLLGQGDMLLLPPGTSNLFRVHGAFVSDAEVKRVADFWREQGKPDYDPSILRVRDEEASLPEDDFQDEMYDAAVAIVAETRQVSISMLQRRLRVGYNRAARMVERMEREGLVGPADGTKPREVHVQAMDLDEPSPAR
jgi:S-DNA-T family DNA segregation ATPase FtsK/SpoIIIE